jgi:lactase-phlorizin hydrolase
LTFNEPHVFCGAPWTYAYLNSLKWNEPPEKPYQCAHNVIKAHALAWRLYDEEFRPSQNGQVGITLNCDWPEPLDPDNPAHQNASDRSMHFHYGWWAHPLMYGEYPPIMPELVDKASLIDEGREESRLPTFDLAWTTLINGTLDFLGLNHYFSYYVIPENEQNSSLWLDGDADIFIAPDDPSWNHTATGWPITPFGIRKVATWVSRQYNMPIYITENGYGHWFNDTTDDPIREDFYRQYINNVLKSIREDGSDIRSYTAWSLIDNMEWDSGFTIRFGVHYVNYSDPELPRSPKRSAMLLKQIFADNGFPQP